MQSVEIEVFTCDVCGGRCDYQTTCLLCGKDLCDKCRIELPYSLNYSGSYDGKYCQECIASNTSDDLLQAYKQMNSLKREVKGFWAEIEPKAKELTKFIEDKRGRK